MSFKVWRNRLQDGFCGLGALQNVPNDQEILAGKSRANGFPSDAYFAMRDDLAKKFKAIPDNVHTMIHDVVSGRLRAVLEPLLDGSRVEFLPVKIHDRAGNVVDGEYFVLNPLDVVDCIDVEASGGKYNELAPTPLMMVARLVLRPIAPNLTLVRPSNWTNRILVRAEIAEQLTAAGLTGLSFSSPEKFRG
jgi:hypothetical protein